MQSTMDQRCSNCGYHCGYEAAAATGVARGSFLYCSSECMWSCELRSSSTTASSSAGTTATTDPASTSTRDPPRPPEQHAGSVTQRVASPPAPQAAGWTRDAAGAAYPSWEMVVAAAAARRAPPPDPMETGSESGDSESPIFELDEELAARRGDRASSNVRRPAAAMLR